jgi:hypothetical protein
MQRTTIHQFQAIKVQQVIPVMNDQGGKRLARGQALDGAPTLLMHLRAIAANGKALAERLPPLLACEGVFDVGESGGEWLAFASAAKAAFSFLSEEGRQAIEAAVLSHRPELAWAKEYLRRSKDGRASASFADPDRYVRHHLTLAGQDERAILKTIGEEQLSPAARTRLAELHRKFAGKPLPEAYGIRGGWVQSPIDQNKAARMSDRHWLSAMARYSDDADRGYFRDFVIGGARQLASVLQAQAKEDPPRFVALLEAMPLTPNATYAEAILGGVREGASDGPLTARAIKTATRWPNADMGRTINWTVQRHPSAAKDPEVLAMVLTSAEFGRASDTAVRTINPDQTASYVGPRVVGAQRRLYIKRPKWGARLRIRGPSDGLVGRCEHGFNHRRPCRTSGRGRAAHIRADDDAAHDQFHRQARHAAWLTIARTLGAKGSGGPTER